MECRRRSIAELRQRLAAHIVGNPVVLTDAVEEVAAKLLVARQQACSLLMLSEDLPGMGFQDEPDGRALKRPDVFAMDLLTCRAY